MDAVLGKVMGKEDLLIPKKQSFYPPEKRHGRCRTCCTNCLTSCWEWIVTTVISTRAFVLVMTALLGPFAFYASYYILLAPAIKTLKAKLSPSLCIVSNAMEFHGMSKCFWTSCREGCTDQEMYICWNIYVIVDDEQPEKTLVTHSKNERYMTDISNSKHNTVLPEKFNSTLKYETELLVSDNEYVDDIAEMLYQLQNMTRLFINVEGCIYGLCKNFWKEYGQIGFTFPCFVSKNKAIAVPTVSYGTVSLQIFFGLIPLFSGLLSVFAIYFIYCRENSTDKSLSLEPDPERARKKWEEVKGQIVQNVMERHKGKTKLDPKRIIEVMKNIKFTKKNKVSPEAFATAVLAVIDAGDGNLFTAPKAGYTGLGMYRVNDNPKSKGAKWRKFAIHAKEKLNLHPTCPPAKQFTEVDFTRDGEEEGRY